MSNNIDQKPWIHQFRLRYPDLCRNDTEKLRLILGLGRSGTTWLSRVLSESPTPIRFFMEGLFSVRPPFQFAAKGDHTAIEYRSTLSEQHPLLLTYQSLVASYNNWKAFGLDKHLMRNDKDWEFCLIKEVHSLLATEALLKSLRCPTVLVIRDPVYVIDSLFTRDGLNSIYLDNESQAVKDIAFLERFLQDQANPVLRVLNKVASHRAVRGGIILEKVLTAAIIQSMLRSLASEFPYTYLIDYDDLCRSPEYFFRSISAFLTLDWGKTVEDFLTETTSSDPEKEKRDKPVFRNTKKQVNRRFKFLNQNEVSLCRQVLRDCGLEAGMSSHEIRTIPQDRKLGAMLSTLRNTTDFHDPRGQIDEKRINETQGDKNTKGTKMTKIHSNNKDHSGHQSDNFPQAQTGQQRQQSILEFINQGDLVFDVGANIGSRTEMFLGKGARVVCFKPQAECAKILKQKFGHNPHVTILEKGLAESSGTLQLSICSKTNVISTFCDKWKTGRFADYNWDKVVTVEVTSLDKIIKTHGLPKYCKIDVEGFEYQVLKGLSHPIPLISFEVTMEFFDDMIKCVSHLEMLGYKEFNFAKGEAQGLVFGDWVSSDILFQYLTNLNDESLWGDIYAKIYTKPNDKESGLKTIRPTLCKYSRTLDVKKESLQSDGTGEHLILSKLLKSGLISPGAVMFDIGANIGDWTKKLLSLKEDIIVHLFEPVPTTYQILLRNISEQIKTGRLFLNNCAIGHKEELKPFNYYEDSSSWSTFYRRPQVEKQYNLKPPKIFSVHTTTLDTYCNLLNIEHISFLKIDVEGAELDVLQGAEKLLAKGLINFIQFEYGGTFLDSGITLQQVFEFLSNYGYVIFKLLPNGLEHKPLFLSSFEDFNYANFIAINRNLQSIFLNEPPKMLNLKKLCKQHTVIPRGVIHIGAHEGKEVEKYLEMGAEKILFIEANPIVFERLQKNIVNLPNVQAVNCAISNKCGSITLHVTSNDQSSSILPLKRHKEIYPDIEETHQGAHSHFPGQ